MALHGMKKTGIAVALAAIVLATLCLSVKPALADTWSKVGSDGFGSKDNVYVLSLASYGGRLYAGTMNNVTGAQMYRSSDGSTWKPVTKDGFGNTSNHSFSSMAVFNNRLYVGTLNNTTGCEVWMYEGNTWTMVSNNGFLSGNISHDIPAMQVFGGQLYAGVEYNALPGCKLYRTTDGVTWNPVVGDGAATVDGFGDGNNTSILSLASFGGYLYAGTHNAATGSEVWRSNNGTVWTQSNADGFTGPPSGPNNTETRSLKSFEGYLYAGTYNAIDRAQLWRTGTGAAGSWTKVSGFGQATTDTAAQSMLVYDNHLYVGTWQSRIYKSSNGTSWGSGTKLGSGTSETPCMATFGAGLYAGTADWTDGGQLWRTYGPAPEINSIDPQYGRVGDTVTLRGSHFGAEREESSVIVGNPSQHYVECSSADYVSWSDTQIKVKIPHNVTGFNLNVYVRTLAGTSNGVMFQVRATACYLAEGSTAWGFSTYISIQNPGFYSCDVHVTFMPTGRENVKKQIHLPSYSLTTLSNDYLKNLLGEADFSTRIECYTGQDIAADRTMEWTGTGSGAGASPEGHCSIGAPSPDTRWYLPEGSSAWGFETWTLVQNPNGTAANVNISYMRESGDPVVKQVQVPATSRQTYSMAEQVGVLDASILVESDVPVIAERSMYRNNRREGHESIGARSPAETFYLAEGCTGFGFKTYVLIQNPNDTPTNVNVTYMTGEGPVQHPEDPIQMPANSRKTIDVNATAGAVFEDPNFSTQVLGDQPIIAERAMYWGDGTELGEACHDSIGMEKPERAFYLPDGQSDSGRETWILVQNPNNEKVDVRVTYMKEGNLGHKSWTAEIPACSRKTFNMLEQSGIEGRAAIMVESRQNRLKILCERSMYWNSRGAGTDTIGGFSNWGGVD